MSKTKIAGAESEPCAGILKNSIDILTLKI
jgi:hypothetical protein